MPGDDAGQRADRDHQSVSEAGVLASSARQAQTQLAELSQEQIDAIVTAMADAVSPHAETLARMAVDETGYGVVADKIQKNLFASRDVYEFIRPIKTVGVVNRVEDRKLVEIAEPFGVVAAIVPSTNPTSTAIYNVLIAIKARCAVVISPHPSAVGCITRTVEILADAAAAAGVPSGSIGWMKTVTLEGTQALMKHRDVAVILATGGMGLVRAAYSAGKPAYGVGPGNAPCYVERTADIAKAASDIMVGKTFDNGVLCSSPNSVIVDESVSETLRREFEALGAHFLNTADTQTLAASLVTPQRLPNPALVGKSALHIAEQAGLSVPADTRVLIAPLEGVGRDYPLSVEKLAPVLSWYVVKDWLEGCERCIQVLRYGGMGHTMSIHSQSEEITLQFGLKKPAFRICVNTPTTHGSIGLTTGLDPALTLGCGGWGGNITSDNISPRHLLNIKRLAYEVRPAVVARPQPTAANVAEAAPPKPTAHDGIPVETLAARIDMFLASRGFPNDPTASPADPTASGEIPPRRGDTVEASETQADAVADFICEEDVLAAMRARHKLLVGEKTILTPSARDLGEAQKVLVQAPWSDQSH